MSGVVIVNSGVCNLDSIRRAIEECSGNPTVTDDPRIVEKADRIILPGVGSFAAAMLTMKEKRLATSLQILLAKRQIPFLGICLGMQLMATCSHEFGMTEGLNLIPGEIIPLRATQAGERIPHMGWNETRPLPNTPLWRGLAEGADFYFVHSYYYDCDKDNILATCPSYGGFAAAVRRDHLMGVQFHPEKSQKAGFQLLRNFLAL